MAGATAVSIVSPATTTAELEVSVVSQATELSQSEKIQKSGGDLPSASGEFHQIAASTLWAFGVIYLRRRHSKGALTKRAALDGESERVESNLRWLGIPRECAQKTSRLKRLRFHHISAIRGRLCVVR